MTEQKRINRIEFVKKLLELKGFVSFKDQNPFAVGYKKYSYFKYFVFLHDDFVSMSMITPCCNKELLIPNYVIYHHQPLKRLRAFIKLSNQNVNDRTATNLPH